ncbi:MAG: O-antigen ligase family protein [Candidatus Omnitrophica bacterium]|nr:O-antigen ligase family protein [Candidatus Omnitrophota bacterium]
MDIPLTKKINIDNIIFCLFAALVFMFPISISAIEILFFCILAFAALKAVQCKIRIADIKAFFFGDKINLAVLIFYICLGISMITSGDLFLKSLRAWTTKWAEGIILFYLARIFLDRDRIKRLLYVLAGSVFLLCIDGLWQKFAGVDFLRGFKMTETSEFLAVRGTFAHYNDFGTFLVVAFFAALGLANYRLDKVPMRIYFTALNIILLVNLIFTYSRGAWSAFFAALILLLFFVRNKRIIVLSLSVICCGVLIAFFIPLSHEKIMVLLTKKDSGRLAMWKDVLDMARQHPLVGCGVGLFMEIFGKLKEWGYQYVHNCYLQMLVETGILGLVSFLLFVGLIIKRVWLSVAQDHDRVVMGLGAAFAAFLVHAFFDTQFYSVQLSTLFWLLSAFLVQMSVARPRPVKGKNTQ